MVYTKAKLLARFASIMLALGLPLSAPAFTRAEFAGETASPQARHIADWVVDSGDSRGLPFVIVDKLASRVFVFDARGQLRGAAPALIGMAQGDDSVPGIGTRAMSAIRPEERTTPAGRFLASMGRTPHGDEILWVDYDAAIALHRVIATVPKERRLQRMASAEPLDHRITYGCINVPVKFFDNVVRPALKAGSGVVYVLPETRSPDAVFGAYETPGSN
jgi:hypothetical protein